VTGDYQSTVMPGPAPEGPGPKAYPQPEVTEIRVEIRRMVWTAEPKGTSEIALGLTASPDQAHGVGASCDFLIRALDRKARAHLEANQ